MTRRILKATVKVDDRWHKVPGGPIVHVDHQGEDDRVHVWFEHDSDLDLPGRLLRVFGTGQPLPDEPTRHVGTVLTPGRSFVWHVRELDTGPRAPRTLRIDMDTDLDPAEVGRQIVAAIEAYQRAGGRA